MSLLMDALRKAEDAKRAAENSLLTAASKLEMHEFSSTDRKPPEANVPESIADPQQLVTETDAHSTESKSGPSESSDSENDLFQHQMDAEQASAEYPSLFEALVGSDDASSRFYSESIANLPAEKTENDVSEVVPIKEETKAVDAVEALTEKKSIAETTIEASVVDPVITYSETPLPTSSPAVISADAHPETHTERKPDTGQEKIISTHGAKALFAAKRQQDKSKLRKRLQLAAAIISLMLSGAAGLWFYISQRGGDMVVSSADFSGNPSPAYEADFQQLALPVSENLPIVREAPPENSALAGSAESNALAQQFLIGTDIQKKNIESDINPLTTTRPKQQVPSLVESSEVVTGAGLAGEPEQVEPIALNRISFSRQKRSDTELESLLIRAYSSYQQGNFELASSLYGEALIMSPTDRNALLGLATIFSQNNEPTQAMTYYSRLLARDPSDAIARAGLLSSRPLGSIGEQEIALKKLLRQHADLPPVIYAMGNFYASQQNWSAAQSYYFDALRQAKSIVSEIGLINPDYAFNLGVSLEHLNQRIPAIAYYQEALVLATKHPASFDVSSLAERVSSLERVGVQ